MCGCTIQNIKTDRETGKVEESIEKLEKDLKEQGRLLWRDLMLLAPLEWKCCLLLTVCSSLGFWALKKRAL
jgi:hypothetical protein